MHSSKLILVLKEFTALELDDLRKFLESLLPYDENKAKAGIALLAVLSPHYPLFDSPNLTKTIVFTQLYPGEVLKIGRLEKQMSLLFSQVQKFIIFRYSEQKSELQQLLILYSFYKNKKLTNLADTTFKKYQKVNFAKDKQGMDYFYDKFIFEKQAVENEVLAKNTVSPTHLPNAMENLDHYYILGKLDLACQFLSFHRLIAPIEMGKNLTVIELLEPLLKEEFFDVPAIKVYYRAYCLLRAKDQNEEAEFLDFEKVLELYQNQIPEDQLKVLQTIIRNYAIVQYHNGMDNYLAKAFRIYKAHLNEGYLYYEGKILPATMANLVVFGLRMKNFDWVFDFLKTHKNKITGTANPTVVYQLNLANYYFHIADYENAQEALIGTSEDAYYKLHAKRLEIKIYYEMKHVLLSSRIDAFKIYIYRLSSKYIIQKQKDGNRNFIDILKQIHLPRTFQNEKRIDKLTSKVKSLKFITERGWLLEKLEELL